MKLHIDVDTLDKESLAQLATLANALNGTAIQGTQEVVDFRPTEEELAAEKAAEEAKKAQEKKDKAAATRAANKAKKDQEAADAKAKEEADKETSQAAKDADVEDPETVTANGTEEPGEVTKEMLQILIREKTSSNRDELKKELTRLDAKNVSTLDEKHYAAFYKFMSDLK